MLSHLPTLGEQILHEMNIEEGWARLQETRKLEKIEARLQKEREIAASLREEEEAMEALRESDTGASGVLVEHETSEDQQEQVESKKTVEKPAEEMDSSVGSLSTLVNEEQERPSPTRILSKREKNLLWDEIKRMSKFFIDIYEGWNTKKTE